MSRGLYSLLFLVVSLMSVSAQRVIPVSGKIGECDPIALDDRIHPVILIPGSRTIENSETGDILFHIPVQAEIHLLPVTQSRSIVLLTERTAENWSVSVYDPDISLKTPAPFVSLESPGEVEIPDTGKVVLQNLGSRYRLTLPVAGGTASFLTGFDGGVSVDFRDGECVYPFVNRSDCVLVLSGSDVWRVTTSDRRVRVPDCEGTPDEVIARLDGNLLCIVYRFGDECRVVMGDGESRTDFRISVPGVLSLSRLGTNGFMYVLEGTRGDNTDFSLVFTGEDPARYVSGRVLPGTLDSDGFMWTLRDNMLFDGNDTLVQTYEDILGVLAVHESVFLGRTGDGIACVNPVKGFRRDIFTSFSSGSRVEITPFGFILNISDTSSFLVPYDDTPEVILPPGTGNLFISGARFYALSSRGMTCLGSHL